MRANDLSFIRRAGYEDFSLEGKRERTDNNINSQMLMLPRFEKQPKQPAVYKVEIKHVDNNKTFKLIKDYDRMPEPPKKYGRLKKIVDRSWNTYTKLKEGGRFGFGIAAVGFKGMGKTDFLSLLANKAIDHGMIVVLVSNIKASIELVNYLTTLNNVFIMFDEFAKNFDYHLQEKMLTMFNNLDNKDRFLAISENSLRDLSDFFLDRPGRIHYLLEFETTDNATIEDYCKDHKVTDTLIKQILESARKTTNFSFDFLKGIVLEHHIYPEDSLEEMLEFLNLKRLQKRSYLDIIKIEKIEKDKHNRNIILSRQEYNFNYKDQVKEKDFKEGRYVYINLMGPKPTEEEIKAKEEELKRKAKENENKKDGENKTISINGASFGPAMMLPVNPFSGERGERLSFSSSQLDLVAREEKNGIEHLEYIYGDYLLTVAFGE